MKRLLLIEDDAWLADSYKCMLVRSGYDVTVTGDADTAIAAVEASVPDGIVADIALEGHTIFVLLNELQSYADTRTVPVILCTNLDQTVLQSAKLGTYGVVKLFDKATLTPDSLSDALRECCS